MSASAGLPSLEYTVAPEITVQFNDQSYPIHPAVTNKHSFVHGTQNTNSHHHHQESPSFTPSSASITQPEVASPSNITSLQNNDPTLLVIKQYLLGIDAANLHQLLPRVLRQQLLFGEYRLIDDTLYYRNMLVVPPKLSASQKLSLLTRMKERVKLFKAMHDAVAKPADAMILCYRCNGSGHLAINCPYVACAVPQNHEIKYSWCCIECGTVNWDQACLSCHDRRPIQESPYERRTEKVRSKNGKLISGVTFYPQVGDCLEDYVDCKVPVTNFAYSPHENILICGECDFSFTAAIIDKRAGTGNSICCTAWNYYKSQFYDFFPKHIGFKEFAKFLSNLKHCKKLGAKVSFGIDAKLLRHSQKQWNRIGAESFDKILFTFPRVYSDKKQHKWAKIQYNHENEVLLLGMLKSMKSVLSEQHGEIHVMLLKGQFCNWRIRRILTELQLEIAYWSEMNYGLLKKHFPGFTPRDAYGNRMKFDHRCTIHYCCLMMELH